MAFYITAKNGRVIKEEKRGRLRKGHKEVLDDGWSQSNVIASPEEYSLKKMSAWINASSIERDKGIVSFFLCNISPSCPIEILRTYRFICRIDIDLYSGSLLIWWLEFIKDQPDLIIIDAIKERDKKK